MKKRGEMYLVWIGVGIAVAAAIVVNVVFLVPRPTSTPPGWQIIRPPHEVSALVQQGDTIWVGGKEGVYRIDRITGQLVETLHADVPLLYVSSLAVDHAGNLWIGHNQGLTCYDGRTCRTMTTADGLPDNRVNALLVDSAGLLWVGTWSGAALRQDSGWQRWTVAQGLLDEMVNVMYQDHRGGMWLGSYVAPRGGLTYIGAGTRQTWNTESGLPHNNVTSITEDSAGTILVGTGFYERGGAAFLERSSDRERSGDPWLLAKTLRHEDGLAGQKVRSVYVDRRGRAWFGSENDGVAILDRGRWQTLTTRDGLAHDEIKVIMEDTDGNVWMATRDGVTRIAASATLLAIH